MTQEHTCEAICYALKRVPPPPQVRMWKSEVPVHPNVTMFGDKVFIYFLEDFIYFFFRARGREGERGRETSMCGCLSCAPYWGPNLQPKHMS